MKFSEALEKTLESGIGIYRPSWNGNASREDSGVHQWVASCRLNPGDPPFPESAPFPVNTPFLFISQPYGCTPWVPSQGDLFAEDWQTL